MLSPRGAHANIRQILTDSIVPCGDKVNDASVLKAKQIKHCRMIEEKFYLKKNFFSRKRVLKR